MFLEADPSLARQPSSKQSLCWKETTGCFLPAVGPDRANPCRNTLGALSLPALYPDSLTSAPLAAFHLCTLRTRPYTLTVLTQNSGGSQEFRAGSTLGSKHTFLGFCKPPESEMPPSLGDSLTCRILRATMGGS